MRIGMRSGANTTRGCYDHAERIRGPMTHWEKLEWLKANTHEVHITVNEHRGYYETVAQHLQTRDEDLFDPEDANIKAECIRRNEIAIVQVYPDTPISFYRVGHYDLGAAIDVAYDCVTIERTTRSRGDKRTLRHRGTVRPDPAEEQHRP